jgi:hypothetical protein
MATQTRSAAIAADVADETEVVVTQVCPGTGCTQAVTSGGH